MITIAIMTIIYNTSEFNKKRITNVIVNNATLQFENIVNIRKWNASYGGLYVKDNGNIKPNPYLKDNHIFTKDDKRLIKINPAWMTRQLSEVENINHFSFRIVSRNPLNIKNKSNEFETNGLEHIKGSSSPYYYEFDKDNKEFRFIGALKTEKSCLMCHKHQGYKEGDIRGGISIYKDITKDIAELKEINIRRTIILSISLITGIIIAILTTRILSINKELEIKIKDRTRKLQEKNEYLERIKNSNKDILVITSGDKLLDTNSAFLEFFEIESMEKFLQSSDCICDFFEKVDSSEYIYSPIIEGESWAKHILNNHDKTFKAMIKKDNKEYVFLLTSEYLIDSDESKILVVFSDITELEESSNRLIYQANVDELTKIMNRKSFNRVIEDEILSTRIDNGVLSIIFFDIDHFKSINDTYGHDMGDKVLIELAELVKVHIRESDFFARWGGEEFVVIVKSSSHGAEILANKLKDMIQIHNFSVPKSITCSFGVSGFVDSDSSESLLKRADKALYIAKESGRNRVITVN
jgi:diguanylate cyclase (GGDEF)-like protein